MRKQWKIIYHHHSGFSIQLGKTLLVFDYWRGDKPENFPLSNQLQPVFLNSFEHVYVFISHSHQDHMDPIIYDWATGLRHVEYLQGDDVPVVDGIPNQHAMTAGDTLDLPGEVQVAAYPSTDLGVSFHVKADGLSIFHAGDLNLWHWRDESTIPEINRAEDEYNAALQAISDLDLDVVMFPVDPRQGTLYTLGADRFIMTLRPRIFIPMHFFDYDYLIRDFAREAQTSFTKVVPMLEDGTQLELNLTEEEGRQPHLSVTTIEPVRQVRSDDPLTALKENQSGPFKDCYQPVKLK